MPTTRKTSQSPITWALLVACFSALPVIDAGVTFRSPPSLAGYHSPRCCAMSWFLPQNETYLNKSLISHVDMDICDDPTPHTLAKYNDTIINCNDIRFRCPNFGPPNPQVRGALAYEQAKKHGAAACIIMWEEETQRNAMVWVGLYVYGYQYQFMKEEEKLQYGNCQFVEPRAGAKNEDGEDLEPLKPLFMENRLRDEQGDFDKPSTQHRLRIDMTIDPNPFLDVLDSIWYKLYFRVFGCIYLYTAYDAMMAFRERKRVGFSDAKIPELMLALEGLTMFLVGTYLIVFGMWDSPYMPQEFVGFANLFQGASLATSLMAGVYFKDLERSIIDMAMNQGKNFWRKKRILIIGASFLCYSIDIFSYFAINFDVPYFMQTTALIQFFGLLFCAISFIRDTNGFLNTVMGTIAQSQSNNAQYKEDRQYKKLIQMAKMLRISAAAIIVWLVQGFVMMLSGSAIKGIHSPGGWFFGMAMLALLRWIPSYAQVQMAKPSSMLKTTTSTKKKIAPKGSTKTGTKLSSSTTSSMVSSSSSSSSSSGSSSSSSSSSSGSSGTSGSAAGLRNQSSGSSSASHSGPTGASSSSGSDSHSRS